MDVLNDIEDGKLYHFIEPSVSIMQTREGWIVAFSAIEFYATR